MTQNTAGPRRRNGSDSRLTLTDAPLTRDEVINRGEKAAQLLGAPVMTLVVQSLVQEIADEWMETDPKEVQKREGLHAESRALARVLNRLASMSGQAMSLSEDVQRAELAAQQLRANSAGYGE
jgi:hypothetical protein